MPTWAVLTQLALDLKIDFFNRLITVESPYELISNIIKTQMLASHCIAKDVPASAAEIVRVCIDMLVQLRPQARNLVPLFGDILCIVLFGSVIGPRVNTGGLCIHIYQPIDHNQSLTLSTSLWVQIQINFLLPISIRATPSMPGRSSGVASSKAASIRK